MLVTLGIEGILQNSEGVTADSFERDSEMMDGSVSCGRVTGYTLHNSRGLFVF